MRLKTGSSTRTELFIPKTAWGRRREEGPAQKLTLTFATADVVLLGWRFDRLADLAVRALPDRYANLDISKSFVAQITVQSMSKD